MIRYPNSKVKVSQSGSRRGKGNRKNRPAKP